MEQSSSTTTSERRDDGGPAFPRQNDDYGPGYPGLSLRDYFAAKAMQGNIASGMIESVASAAFAAGTGDDGEKMADAMQAAMDSIASVSYGFADSMLRARKAVTP